jgi:SAM-dependent methyltransferase
MTDPAQPIAASGLSAIEAAHRQYNAALTRLDAAIQAMPGWPDVPPPPDQSQARRVNETWNILPAGTPSLGGGIRGRLAGFVWRLLGPALQQQLTFNAAVVDHLNRTGQAQSDAHRLLSQLVPVLREGFEALGRFESLLVQFAQQITPLADARERAIQAGIAELRTVAAVAQRASAATQREIEKLVAVSPASAADTAPSEASAQSVVQSHKYVGFEDRFRGSEEDIRARLEAYVPYFAGAADVLDVGCGRGEFLELMRAAGVSARGLDVNAAMVEVCRAKGLDAVRGDALGYLGSLPDQSLGGIIAVQVVEHLDPDYLMRFLQAAFHTLRPGSHIVLETINPTCWVAFFESYIRDLTHVRPVHPETLQYLLVASGFHQVDIVYRSPVGDKLLAVEAPPARSDRSPDPLAPLIAAFNQNVERLNARMFTYLDYAAVGVRS